MSSYLLKIFAMITMAIDHTGDVFFPSQDIWRVVGRIAMPLYSLMAADACRHVSRREGGMRRYLLFLATVALASELFYDYAFEGVPVSLESQNQVAQFFCFALTYAVCKKISFAPARAAVWMLSIALNNAAHLGYSGAGILLPLMFCMYLDRFKKHGTGWRLAVNALIMLAFICFQFGELALKYYDAGYILPVIVYLLTVDGINRGVFLAVPLLAMYDGSYGDPPPRFRIFYKYFYPLHLAAICALALLTIR